jgi:hypothetical protein
MGAERKLQVKGINCYMKSTPYANKIRKVLHTPKFQPGFLGHPMRKLANADMPRL